MEKRKVILFFAIIFILFTLWNVLPLFLVLTGIFGKLGGGSLVNSISEFIFNLIYLILGALGFIIYFKNINFNYNKLVGWFGLVFFIIGLFFMFQIIGFIPIIYWFFRFFSGLEVIILNFLIGAIGLYTSYFEKE